MAPERDTYGMKRTTIMAEEELLERLRRIARLEGVSLAEVIRQGMEMRAQPQRTEARRTLKFIGAGESKPGLPPVDWNADMVFEPPPWRS